MATPRAAPKRSGSSNGKWLFTGMDQIHATIPSEIAKPVAALCEMGHTWFTRWGRSWPSSRAPDATQRHFDDALQSRGPCVQSVPCGFLGPGSAQQRHSVSKTRVNALVALQRVRDTRELKLNRTRRLAERTN